MMRAADGGKGDTLFTGYGRKFGSRKIKGWIGKAMRGVDRQHRRARSREDRLRLAIHFAGTNLLHIGRNAAQAVAGLAGSFRLHKGTGDGKSS
ncbi:hypothetical protein D3C71_1660120 [compost metagenome]